MATDMSLLQGEVVENPKDQVLDVEQLLAGFLRALLDEQREQAPVEPEARCNEPGALRNAPESTGALT